jgi:hypothetical protein
VYFGTSGEQIESCSLPHAWIDHGCGPVKQLIFREHSAGLRN